MPLSSVAFAAGSLNFGEGERVGMESDSERVFGGSVLDGVLTGVCTAPRARASERKEEVDSAWFFLGGVCHISAPSAV